MNELEQIGTAFNAALAAGESIALASVVAVRGSAYRRPGARMLVSDGGRRVGSVSGGCLERDVIRHATRALLNGKAALRLYDSLDEDLAEGFALGCNGAVLVLIEPLNANLRHQLEFMADCVEQRRRGAIATVYACSNAVDCELGARVSVLEGGAPKSSGIACAELRRALEDAVCAALEQGRNRDFSFTLGDQTVSCQIEVLRPPLRVIVFGAGHDVEPLVDFGASLGWNMEVVASNGGFGVRERFHKATAIHFGSPDDAVATLRPDEDSIVLLMSHNFPLDLAAFRALLPCRPRYIGLLGPRHRAERLLSEAALQGERIDDELQARIFGPVGLDVGAETPAEVALAICAEITAVCRARAGGSARKRKTALHDAQHEQDPDAAALYASLEAAADFSCGLSVA